MGKRPEQIPHRRCQESMWKDTQHQGHLGGSVSSVSDFGSGHDLAVHEFKPHIRLCADCSEPEACFGFCVSLSPCSSHARALPRSSLNIK